MVVLANLEKMIKKKTCGTALHDFYILGRTLLLSTVTKTWTSSKRTVASSKSAYLHTYPWFVRYLLNWSICVNSLVSGIEVMADYGGGYYFLQDL